MMTIPRKMPILFSCWLASMVCFSGNSVANNDPTLRLEVYPVQSTTDRLYNVIVVANGSGSYAAVSIDFPDFLTLNSTVSCVHSADYCSDPIVEDLNNGYIRVSLSGPGTNFDPAPSVPQPSRTDTVRLTITLTLRAPEFIPIGASTVIFANMTGLFYLYDPSPSLEHEANIDILTGLPTSDSNTLVEPTTATLSDQLDLDQGVVWVSPNVSGIAGSYGDVVRIDTSIPRSLSWGNDTIVVYIGLPNTLGLLSGPPTNANQPVACDKNPPSTLDTDALIRTEYEGNAVADSFEFEILQPEDQVNSQELCLLYAGYSGGSISWYQQIRLSVTIS